MHVGVSISQGSVTTLTRQDGQIRIVTCIIHS